jgi:hypothetical protein
MILHLNHFRRWCLVLTAVLVCLGLSPACGQGGAPTVMDVKVDPEQPRTGDTIKIWFRLGEGAERVEVRWSVNDEEVQLTDYVETEKYVELDRPVKAGDKIVATITPFDAGGEAGKAIVRQLVCADAPPELKVVDQRIEKDAYRARIEARDPQGGTVSLILEQAPSGMKMDSKGSIEWALGKDTAGKFPVRVRAKSDKSGETVLSFDVGIKRQTR